MKILMLEITFAVLRRSGMCAALPIMRMPTNTKGILVILDNYIVLAENGFPLKQIVVMELMIQALPLLLIARIQPVTERLRMLKGMCVNIESKQCAQRS